MKDQKHPMQPLCVDKSGVIRFKENPLVRYLLDAGTIDMNQLAMLPGVDEEHYEQFAQLIGYSVCGFGSLSYASDETTQIADTMADAWMEHGVVLTEKQARDLIKESNENDAELEVLEERFEEVFGTKKILISNKVISFGLALFIVLSWLVFYGIFYA